MDSGELQRDMGLELVDLCISSIISTRAFDFDRTKHGGKIHVHQIGWNRLPFSSNRVFCACQQGYDGRCGPHLCKSGRLGQPTERGLDVHGGNDGNDSDFAESQQVRGRADETGSSYSMHVGTHDEKNAEFDSGGKSLCHRASACLLVDGPA